MLPSTSTDKKNDDEETSLLGGGPTFFTPHSNNRASSPLSRAGNGSNNIVTRSPPAAAESAARRRRRSGGGWCSCSCSGLGLFPSRFCLLLLLSLAVLASLAATGVYFQGEIGRLQEQLNEQNQLLRQEMAIVQEHGTVIERFNSSLTNKDILEQLSLVEESVNHTAMSVSEELSRTKQQIQNQLNNTVQELSEKVHAAETEIEGQVNIVKNEVSQYRIATQDQFDQTQHFLFSQLAGTFTLLSCLISMWHMTAHLRKLNQPQVQRKILAILWMAPIYAVTSWLSLVLPRTEGYLAIIKDGYEGYVIYQFLSFLISVLGKGDRNAVVDLLARHADHLTPPIRCATPLEACGLVQPHPYENDRALADAVLLQCQFFTLQFVLLRPLTSIATEVIRSNPQWGAAAAAAADGDPGSDDWHGQMMLLLTNPSTYNIAVQNISIFTAFAGLLKFYHVTYRELAWCRPFAKFLCIKGVVFMTFWQSLALQILASATSAGSNLLGGSGGAENGTGADNSAEWARTAQNFLICLEMLFFSIAHKYCFPTDEWQDGYRVKHEQGNFGDSMALGDFLSDVKLILSTNKTKKKKKKKKAALQPAIPEGDEEATQSSETVVDEEKGKPAVALEGEQTMLITTSVGNTGDDDDSSAVSALSSMTSSFTSRNEEVAAAQVARALEECLGSCAGDPDIEEAKERLLASNVLKAEFFDSKDENLYSQEEIPSEYSSLISPLAFNNTGGGNGDDHKVNGEEENDKNTDLLATSVDDGEAAEQQPLQDQDGVNDSNDRPELTTGLLSGQDGTDLTETQRPSILTTMPSSPPPSPLTPSSSPRRKGGKEG